MHIDTIATPRVLVDRAKVQANLDRMQAVAAEHNLRLRPHTKTHKSVMIGRWQVDRGASGICCAKLGEAEVFAQAGFDDIRLPYPIHPSNADRVLALQDRARLSIAIDHPGVAEQWSKAMMTVGRRLDVLIKVDVGYHRCGIDPASTDAAEFIRVVAALPGLSLRGLLSHAGHAYAATTHEDRLAIARDEASALRALAQAARARGVRIEEISVGATPTARLSAEQEGVTELRPGTYVYGDRSQVAMGATTLDDCALHVLATVVSKPAVDRVVLDAGSKTLSSDSMRGVASPLGFGVVYPRVDATHPDDSLRIERLSEEHAVVRALTGATQLEPGDRVRVLPNHACVVSNLVGRLCLVDGTEIVDEILVDARGQIT